MSLSEKVACCTYYDSGVLMRKWRHCETPAKEESKVYHQIVLPQVYRQSVLEFAHDNPLAGHRGIQLTQEKLLRHFWWPGIMDNVKEYCRTCHVCQKVGKPGQHPTPALLQPVTAIGQAFEHIIVDCVGPTPKTKCGNEYLLTIIDKATRFREAIPLRNIKTPTIVKALTNYFTKFGLPITLQSDQGSNLMAKLFKEVIHQLIEQVSSSAYHAESQGAVERWHQTMKQMLRTFMETHQKDWDEGFPFVLFASRDSVQTALGFTSFELVYGHSPRGFLKLVKDKLLTDDQDHEKHTSVIQYICQLKDKVREACKLAKDHLGKAQTKMIIWYDRKAKDRKYSPGVKVMAL